MKIFLDIDKYSINLDHVTHIYRGAAGRVTIELDAQDGDEPAYITLRGNKAVAFKTFWENVNLPGVTVYKVC